MKHGSLAEEAKRGEGVHAETRDPRSTRGGATNYMTRTIDALPLARWAPSATVIS